MSRKDWRDVDALRPYPNGGPGMRPASVVLFLASAVALAGAARAVQPEKQEPKVLLTAVDMTPTELGPRAARILDRIQKAPDTVGKVQVVRVHEDALDGKTPVVVRLPEQVVLWMSGQKVTTSDLTKRVDWKSGADAVHLSVSDGFVNGLIYADGKVFCVEPLGPGVHAVRRVDQGKLKDEPPAKRGAP